MGDGPAAELESTLREPEFQRLLQAAAHGPFPCRDRSILHLFWDFGLTLRQIVALQPGQVDLLARRLQLPGGRWAPLPDETLRLLTAYVSLERDPRCPRLFAARHGRPAGPAEVDRLFRRLRAHSGLPVDPLALRRAALARLLQLDPRPVLALWREAAAQAGSGGR